MECAGAPLKHTFLIEDIAGRAGNRGYEIHYAAPQPALFSVPPAHDGDRAGGGGGSAVHPYSAARRTWPGAKARLTLVIGCVPFHVPRRTATRAVSAGQPNTGARSPAGRAVTS